MLRKLIIDHQGKLRIGEDYWYLLNGGCLGDPLGLSYYIGVWAVSQSLGSFTYNSVSHRKLMQNSLISRHDNELSLLKMQLTATM